MIVFRDGKFHLLQGTKMEPIERWEVRFTSPFGWSPDLDQVTTTVVSLDLDPNLVIKPVIFAVSSSMEEESK